MKKTLTDVKNALVKNLDSSQYKIFMCNDTKDELISYKFKTPHEYHGGEIDYNRISFYIITQPADEELDTKPYLAYEIVEFRDKDNNRENSIKFLIGVVKNQRDKTLFTNLLDEMVIILANLYEVPYNVDSVFKSRIFYSLLKENKKDYDCAITKLSLQT